MESAIEPKTYELTYHLNPDIEESEVGTHVQRLQNLIVGSNGSVLTSKEPKRKHLSYPIKQKKYSYFGVLDFTADPEIIAKVDAELKLHNDVLRYLLTKKEYRGKELRVLGVQRPRVRMKTHEPSVLSREEITRAAKPKEEIKPEQLEQEIEEALEKI